MNCRTARRGLAGYLDGAISGTEHALIRQHVETCGSCRIALQSYRRLEFCLARLNPVQAPANLAVQIRLMAARMEMAPSLARRMWLRTKLLFENILEPLAVPATGGVVVAMLAFLFVVQGILVGIPFGAVHDDQPTNLVQPAQLESLPPFPLPGVSTGSASGSLMVEVTLGAQGEVANYRIVSGPDDPAVRRQIDQVLLFSRFRPEMSFGRPTAGGQLMLGFSEIRVRG
jgi:Putative zinc-finger